jgi:hypothetical protein
MTAHFSSNRSDRPANAEPKHQEAVFRFCLFTYGAKAGNVAKRKKVGFALKMAADCESLIHIRENG